GGHRQRLLGARTAGAVPLHSRLIRQLVPHSRHDLLVEVVTVRQVLEQRRMLRAPVQRLSRVLAGSARGGEPPVLRTATARSLPRPAARTGWSTCEHAVNAWFDDPSSSLTDHLA